MELLERMNISSSCSDAPAATEVISNPSNIQRSELQCLSFCTSLHLQNNLCRKMHYNWSNVHEQRISSVSIFAVTFQFVGGYVECNSSELILCMRISLFTFCYLPCAFSASFAPSCCYPDAAVAWTDTDPFALSCSLFLSDIFGVRHALQGQAALLCTAFFLEVLAPSPCERWLSVWRVCWDTGKDDVCIQLKKQNPSREAGKALGSLAMKKRRNAARTQCQGTARGQRAAWPALLMYHSGRRTPWSSPHHSNSMYQWWLRTMGHTR